MDEDLWKKIKKKNWKLKIGEMITGKWKMNKYLLTEKQVKGRIVNLKDCMRYHHHRYILFSMALNNAKCRLKELKEIKSQS